MKPLDAAFLKIDKYLASKKKSIAKKPKSKLTKKYLSNSKNRK